MVSQLMKSHHSKRFKSLLCFPRVFNVFRCNIFHLEENVSRKRWFRELALIFYKSFDQSFDEIRFSFRRDFNGAHSGRFFCMNFYTKHPQLKTPLVSSRNKLAGQIQYSKVTKCVWHKQMILKLRL